MYWKKERKKERKRERVDSMALTIRQRDRTKSISASISERYNFPSSRMIDGYIDV